MTSKLPRILVAEDTNALSLIANILTAYDVVPVTRMQEAVRMIVEDGIDLFIIGVHFDESRAIELAQYARREEKHAQTPILIVRLLPSRAAESLRGTISALVKVGAVDAYLESDDRNDLSAGLIAAVEQLLPVQVEQIH